MFRFKNMFLCRGFSGQFLYQPLKEVFRLYCVIRAYLDGAPFVEEKDVTVLLQAKSEIVFKIFVNSSRRRRLLFAERSHFGRYGRVSLVFDVISLVPIALLLVSRSLVIGYSITNSGSWRSGACRGPGLVSLGCAAVSPSGCSPCRKSTGPRRHHSQSMQRCSNFLTGGGGGALLWCSSKCYYDIARRGGVLK